MIKEWNPLYVMFAMMVVCVAVMPSKADVSYSLDGGMMTVKATSSFAGKGLVLLWDAADRGDIAAGWANSTNFVTSVPAGGGTFTVNLNALGITNGTPCRIAAAAVYKRLDMLQMASTQTYVNTGILGSDVHGLRFGFCPTGKSGAGSSDLYSAVNCGKDNKTSTIANRGGFSVCVAQSTDIHRFRFLWRGENYDKGDNKVDTDTINEYAFTNSVCTLNGTIQQTGLTAGAISTNGHSVFLGRCSYTTYSLYGWWSHVSFDDKDGNRILDYIPVQRASDGKIGFYDRATKSFVTSSGTGNFTAGTAVDDTPVVAVNSRSPALAVKTIPGLVITFH